MQELFKKSVTTIKMTEVKGGYFKEDFSMINKKAVIFLIISILFTVTINTVLAQETLTYTKIKKDISVNMTIVSASMSEDGRYLAFLDNEGTIYIYNPDTGGIIKKWLAYSKEDEGVSGDRWDYDLKHAKGAILLSPKGNYVISQAGKSKIVKLFSLSDKNESNPGAVEFKLPDQVSCFAFSPNEELIAFGTRGFDAGNTVFVYNTKTSNKLWDIQQSAPKIEPPKSQRLGPQGERPVFSVTEQIIKTLAFNNDGALLASGSTDGSILVWESKTGKAISKFLFSGKKIYANLFSKDSKKIFYCSNEFITGSNGIITSIITSGGVIQISDGEIIYFDDTYAQPSKMITANNEDMVIIDKDSGGGIVVWSTKTGKQIEFEMDKVIDFVSGYFVSCKENKDGQTIISINKIN